MLLLILAPLYFLFFFLGAFMRTLLLLSLMRSGVSSSELEVLGGVAVLLAWCGTLAWSVVGAPCPVGHPVWMTSSWGVALVGSCPE